MSFSSVVVALSSPSSPLPARVAAKACLETLQEMVEGFRVCAAVLSEEEVLSPDFATQTRFLAAQIMYNTLRSSRLRQSLLADDWSRLFSLCCRVYAALASPGGGSFESFARARLLSLIAASSLHCLRLSGHVVLDSAAASTARVQSSLLGQLLTVGEPSPQLNIELLHCVVEELEFIETPRRSETDCSPTEMHRDTIATCARCLLETMIPALTTLGSESTCEARVALFLAWASSTVVCANGSLFRLKLREVWATPIRGMMLAAVRTSTWTNAVAFFTELVSKPCPKALDEGETSDTSSWAAQCSCVLELARECLAMAPSLAPDTLTSILLELIRSQGPIVITCSLLTSCGLPADAVATTASAVGRPLLSWLQGLTASVPCSMLQLQLVCEALEVWFFLFEDLETMSPSILDAYVEIANSALADCVRLHQWVTVSIPDEDSADDMSKLKAAVVDAFQSACGKWPGMLQCAKVIQQLVVRSASSDVATALPTLEASLALLSSGVENWACTVSIGVDEEEDEEEASAPHQSAAGVFVTARVLRSVSTFAVKSSPIVALDDDVSAVLECCHSVIGAVMGMFTSASPPMSLWGTIAELIGALTPAIRSATPVAEMYCGLLLSSLPALFTCLQSVDDQSSWNALVSTSESLSTLMLHRLRHCDHVGLPSLASSLASALCWSPGSSLPPLIISLINRRAACLRPYIRLLSLLSTLKDCAAPSTVPALPALLAFLSSSPSPASSLMVTRDCVLGCTQAPSLCKRVPLIVPYVSAAVGVVWGNLTTRMQSIAREGEDGRNLVVSFLLAIITELLTSNDALLQPVLPVLCDVCTVASAASLPCSEAIRAIGLLVVRFPSSPLLPAVFLSALAPLLTAAASSATFSIDSSGVATVSGIFPFDSDACHSLFHCLELCISTGAHAPLLAALEGSVPVLTLALHAAAGLTAGGGQGLTVRAISSVRSFLCCSVACSPLAHTVRPVSPLLAAAAVCGGLTGGNVTGAGVSRLASECVHALLTSTDPAIAEGATKSLTAIITSSPSVGSPSISPADRVGVAELLCGAAKVLPTRQFTAVFNSAELVLCGRLKLSVAVEDVQGMLKADSKRYTARGARRRPPSPPPGEEDAVVDVG